MARMTQLGLSLSGDAAAKARARKKKKSTRKIPPKPAEAQIGVEPCCLCGSTERRFGGWTHAHARSFVGRVHFKCLEVYNQAVALWRQQEHFEGGPILEEIQCPKEGKGWAINSPEFLIVEHIWHHAGSLT